MSFGFEFLGLRFRVWVWVFFFCFVSIGKQSRLTVCPYARFRTYGQIVTSDCLPIYACLSRTNSRFRARDILLHIGTPSATMRFLSEKIFQFYQHSIRKTIHFFSKDSGESKKKDLFRARFFCFFSRAFFAFFRALFLLFFAPFFVRKTRTATLRAPLRAHQVRPARFPRSGAVAFSPFLMLCY